MLLLSLFVFPATIYAADKVRIGAPGDPGMLFSGITLDAEAKLVAYAWPGNVRELANVIERAAVLSDGPELTGEDLPLRIAAAEGKKLPTHFRIAMRSM
jgi:DNA-binding NtrC family response regulator